MFNRRCHCLLPFITAITCPPSTAPSNGSVVYSSIADENDTYAFDVVATYSCFTGFSLGLAVEMAVALLVLLMERLQTVKVSETIVFCFNCKLANFHQL